MPIFEALGLIRANRVFSPIRIDIRAIHIQSSLLSYVLEGRFAKKIEARIDSRESAHEVPEDMSPVARAPA